MADRGIIIVPPFTFDGHRLSFGEGFDPVSLRQYLLYWDKLDWPDNNVIGMGSDEDMDFLQSAGVLDRTQIQFSSFSGNIGYAMLGMQLAALELRNQNEPGAWSLAQKSTQLVSTSEDTVETRTIEVELYSALPVPSAEVPFEELLEFKKRRSDELLRFRAAMDDLYQQVINSADIPRAKLQAINELQTTLQDLNDIIAESFPRRLIGSLKVELNMPNIAATAIAGGLAATTFPIPLEVGAAAGAIAAAVKFELSEIRKSRRIPDELKDYAYLHYITQELR